jgi:hypothetical protein
VAETPRKPRKPRKTRGFGEAQAPFGAVGASLAPVFEAYGYRCAFTGDDLHREAAADPYGAVIRLRGTSNAPADVIPACIDAIHAFESGHMALGTRHEFLVAKDVINPEFDERLRPIGHLDLPEQTAFHPDATLLHRHRQAFCEGRIATR